MRRVTGPGSNNAQWPKALSSVSARCVDLFLLFTTIQATTALYFRITSILLHCVRVKIKESRSFRCWIVFNFLFNTKEKKILRNKKKCYLSGFPPNHVQVFLIIIFKFLIVCIFLQLKTGRQGRLGSCTFHFSFLCVFILVDCDSSFFSTPYSLFNFNKWLYSFDVLVCFFFMFLSALKFGVGG